MKNGNRSYLYMLPLALLGGWAAGAMTARRLMRKEIDRLEALRAAPTEPAPPVASPQAEAPRPAPAVAEEEITEETLMVISAAVAAFLGKRARVRSVRMVQPGTSPWAQAGRVSIQASHVLPRQ